MKFGSKKTDKERREDSNENQDDDQDLIRQKAVPQNQLEILVKQSGETK